MKNDRKKRIALMAIEVPSTSGNVVGLADTTDEVGNLPDTTDRVVKLPKTAVNKKPNKLPSTVGTAPNVNEKWDAGQDAVEFFGAKEKYGKTLDADQTSMGGNELQDVEKKIRATKKMRKYINKMRD